MNGGAIGVFDSGIGGLTVVKEIFARFPNERIIYFGDTARVPYGSKSIETIRRYAVEDAELLLQQGISLLIVACNTVSAVALDAVTMLAADMPVIGMITPAARRAVRSTRSGKIGVIGTQATIASNAYDEAVTVEAAQAGKWVSVFSAACPLFVPLAEEGWTDHPAAYEIAKTYLAPLKQEGIDTLILGCTHYPVLTDVIQQVIGNDVMLISSGAAACDELETLQREQRSSPADHLFLVSDNPEKFRLVGNIFLGGNTLPSVQQVVYKEAWVIHR
jgi:glutamate racemase